MRDCLGRLVLASIPLLIGIAIGTAWCEVGRKGAEAADKSRRKGTIASSAVQQSAAPAKAGNVQRFGSVIGVKPEKVDEYVKLHAAVVCGKYLWRER